MPKRSAFRLGRHEVDKLRAGDVGYIIGSVKTCKTPAWATPSPLRDDGARPTAHRRLPEVKPMVFSGIYPTDSDDFEDLRARSISSSSTTPP